MQSVYSTQDILVAVNSLV